MAQPDGLLFGYELDGAGQAKRLDWAAIRAGARAPAFQWVHLSCAQGRVSSWLTNGSCLSEQVVEALTEASPNPRCETLGDSTLLILRSVTLVAHGVPDDVHTVRLWIERNRVVSVQRYPVAAIADVEERLVRGQGPSTVGELVADLTEHLIDRMDVIIGALVHEVDRLEDAALGSDWRSLGAPVAKLRQQALALRRTIAPQRDALSRLSLDRQGWMSAEDRARIRESANQALRISDDLNAVRERASLVNDQLAERRSDDMNRNMLLLTMATVGLAPMNLISSMLGMNVGGIPGAQADSAFLVVTLLFVLLGVAMAFVFPQIIGR
jgi:zinc transporter